MITICLTRLKAPYIGGPDFSYLRASIYYLQAQQMVNVQYIIIEVCVCSQCVWFFFFFLQSSNDFLES